MIEINNKCRRKIDLRLVNKIAEKFLEVYKRKNYNLSIAFVGDKRMRQLNKKYRHIDKTTDVLAFPGDKEDKFFGEIILNYSQIIRQANKFNNTPKQELIFILVHGLLHLLGYNDETEEEKKKMEKLGLNFIKKYL